MALDPNTKTIKILSNSPMPVEATEGGARTTSDQPQTRRNKKKKFIIPSVTVQKEGGGTSPGTLDQLSSTRVPGSDITKAVGAVSNLTEKGATVGPIAPSVGGMPQRVILAKTKKKSNIILAGPKPHMPELKHKKTAKKLNVNLKGLTRKVKKARNIENNTSGTTLDDIKAVLVKAELVNANTKAPEKMLRQMYSDLMVLKKRAL
jgi:hypothetical protein